MRRSGGDGREIRNEGSGRNLLVQRILGIRHAEPPPDMRDFFIERQNRFRVRGGDLSEPALQALGLLLETLNTSPVGVDIQGTVREGFRSGYTATQLVVEVSLDSTYY